MGAGGIQRRPALREPDPEERVAAIMDRHGRTLLRAAHHWSLCHDDALDAYQRGLEIFLKRAHAVDPATEVQWLKVVIKHEALAIRRTRQDSVGGEEVDLDAQPAPAQRSVDEQIAGVERISRSAEALRALKPDEARALMLKAEGLSYREIGEQCGWTYTKVNRSITEGRRRFMAAYAAIEAGDECDRFAPTLAALAGGTATSAEVLEIRPHLRHCVACRATVRELHMSRLRRLQILLPVGLLAPLRRLRYRGERSEGVAPEELATDVVIPAKDLVLETPAVDPSQAVEGARRVGPGRIKDELLALFHRTSPSDVAAGIHVATAGGGGRIAGVAAVIGFCVSGMGAGALCVATGVVKAPGWLLEEPASAPKKPLAEARAKPEPARPAQVASHSEPTATATLTGRPRRPVRTEEQRTRAQRPARKSERAPRRTAAEDPSQGTAPDSQENAPISEAPSGSVAEFSPEQTAPSSSSQPAPAPAPATGGGEFAP